MFVSLHVYVLLDGQKIERLIVSLATIKASSKYTCKGKTIDIGLFKQKKDCSFGCLRRGAMLLEWDTL